MVLPALCLSWVKPVSFSHVPYLAGQRPGTQGEHAICSPSIQETTTTRGFVHIKLVYHGNFSKRPAIRQRAVMLQKITVYKR